MATGLGKVRVTPRFPDDSLGKRGEKLVFQVRVQQDSESQGRKVGAWVLTPSQLVPASPSLRALSLPCASGGVTRRRE